ncbi:MAG: UDP-3-O-(3-hydroxymyristoyl)glucosamine N-acyltransferase [Planctomycetota bacterium]|jgi:UDP-3-O-[3-hydroxymyristoyl] glucosamine N-acyltransferase
MVLTIAQLAERIGGELVGDGSGRVSAVGTVETAAKDNVTFAKDDKHIAELGKSHAGAVIVTRRIDGLAKPQLVVKDVDTALIEALTIFAPDLKAAEAGIDPTAKVARDAKVGKGVSIGPGVVIDVGVQIGENSIIDSGCRIGENSKIGKNCRFDHNVVIYHNCTIGNNVIVQANSTIGSTGFGYSFINGVHRLIPHNGTVVIEDFVEIGANCCIDRAKFGETRIGAGTKTDNLIQIAHNVIIGKCCLIAGQVGIAGSCKVGDGVMIGGQAGLADNIEIGDGVMVGAQSGVMCNVSAGEKVTGMPAREVMESFRIMALSRRLPRMVEQLKQLTARIEKLETAKDDKK